MIKLKKLLIEDLNEDGHTDVPSAIRKLKTSIEDANEITQKLQSMSEEESLPSWWSDKITLSANYLNKARDYILNPNESVNERSNPSDKKELLRALKNSKVADVFSLNNDELVIEMTSPSGTNFVVGNIRKYKGD